MYVLGKKKFKTEGPDWQIITLKVTWQIKAAESWALQFINCQVIKYKAQSSFLMWIKEQHLFTKWLNLNESTVYLKLVCYENKNSSIIFSKT